MEKSFVERQKRRIELRIQKYGNRDRIQDELLLGKDVSAYTRYKQETIIPILRDALKRIENGSYGICLHCGKQIERKRLELIPAAQYCLRCSQELDIKDTKFKK
jgi:RNA polymerase-binding transcription factor DksA